MDLASRGEQEPAILTFDDFGIWEPGESASENPLSQVKCLQNNGKSIRRIERALPRTLCLSVIQGIAIRKAAELHDLTGDLTILVSRTVERAVYCGKAERCVTTPFGLDVLNCNERRQIILSSARCPN